MKKEQQSRPSAATDADSSRPLSALLSQMLVAFTVEFDNEFERQIAEAGHPGARLSLVVWSNLIRFIPPEGISVREIVSNSLLEQTEIKLMLGCLERWGFVALQAGSVQQAPQVRVRGAFAVRDGFGSGRGINVESLVRLTETRGEKARQIWPPLFELIESRWRERFGADEVAHFRDCLAHIADQLDVELPHGFTDIRYRRREFPTRRSRNSSKFSLPTLLAQALFAFAIEFERESAAPLALCANAIRVLGEQPTREGEIPRLTGSSPETSGIGWQLKPYIVVERAPSTERGKVVRLSSRGLEEQRRYGRLVAEIEKRWQSRFGKEHVEGLRDSLEALLDAEKGEHLMLSEGLIPPSGTVRAGDISPALGRRDIGSAAKQRARDLVAQTEDFVRDPTGTLPHYPLWDMNRGFGP
ncbi:MAG TPA: hypothetical protein VJN69_07710 [Candidatus Acidoferrales bacterium]|nr:hypothetical protein [Candidatus Acidoferrales bacterium]